MQVLLDQILKIKHHRGVVYGAREAHNLPGQVRPLAPQHCFMTAATQRPARTDNKKNYPLFEVSCKVLILNPARDKILLAAYDDGLYSLPGGHLEPGETPAVAARRELAEELSLQTVSDLRAGNFFFHAPKAKVILMFVATLDDKRPLPPIGPNDEHLLGGEWIDIADFRADAGQKYCDATYRAMILSLLD